MTKAKKSFVIFALFIFIFISINSICYATSVPVTEENLNNSLQSFVSSNSNEDNYQISMSDGKMTVKVDEESYTLDYDLTNNPTFSLSIPIEQGMTYDEFIKQTDNLSLPMLGYIGVANVQGVSIEDASSYFAMCLLMNAFSSMSSSSSKYIIATDGTTVESSDATVIYESEFGNHVMEYVNSMYSTKQTFSDSTEMGGFNTFTWSIEETDVTSTSCNLLSTVTVNLNADFSKINGYANKVNESFLNKDITEENADYVIKLKVGQKCNIESSEKITGYEISGSSCVDFNEDKTVITAKSVGKANGYLYIGDSNTKKSIYIIVEENTLNQTLAPISIKINTTSNTDKPSTDNPNTSNPGTSSNNPNTTKNDNTISQSKLPQAGTNETLFILIISIIVIFAIIFKIRIKKYKDIK